MDRIVWLPSAILGLLMVAIYLVACARGARQFDLYIMVNVMLCSGGAVGGVLLIAATFMPSLQSSLSSLGPYVIIGGLAVFVVSVRELWRYVLAREKEK